MVCIAKTHDTSFGTRCGVWDTVAQVWRAWGLSDCGEAQYRIDRGWYSCSPPPCQPVWKCEVPANGYESDGCGNRRMITACNPGPPPCQPVWKCEVPANGYESDGCGNRRANAACKPSTPPGECAEGTTRTVKCPQDATKTVTQKCVNGAWVTTDVTKCQEKAADNTLLIVAVVIIVAFLLIFGRK